MVVGSQVGGYSFDAAVVSYSGMLNVAVSGGVLLSTSGLSFGNFDYTASSEVSARACSSVSWVSGTTLENPDFAAWCAAFGVPVTRIDSNADMPALAAALAAPGPAAIVVRTSLAAVLPAPAMRAAE
jgi:hypothetical protein